MIENIGSDVLRRIYKPVLFHIQSSELWPLFAFIWRRSIHIKARPLTKFLPQCVCPSHILEFLFSICHTFSPVSHLKAYGSDAASTDLYVSISISCTPIRS